MECDADGRERMMQLRLNATPCSAPRTSNDHHIPVTTRVGSAVVSEVLYGAGVAAYTLGGRATHLHPFTNTVLLPACRWRLGGQLDGTRVPTRYFDVSQQVNTHDWTTPHEAAVAAADQRVRDRAWCSYLAAAIAHGGPQHESIHKLLARAAVACGTLPLSCRLVHLCVQPTPAAARIMIETLPATAGVLARCAWVAAAALASSHASRQDALQQGVQWMMTNTQRASQQAACAALDLWLRLLDDLDNERLESAVKSIHAVAAGCEAPGAAWTAELGQRIRMHGLGDAVWPICLHVLLTGKVPPVARWRLGYPQQPVTLCAVDKGAPLAVEVLGKNHESLERVWAAVMGDHLMDDNTLQTLLCASHVAAVPTWAPLSPGNHNSSMHGAMAQATVQTDLATLHSLLACSRGTLQDDAAEMQTPRVLALVTQSISDALRNAVVCNNSPTHAALCRVGVRAAHALIATVQALPPLMPLGGALVSEPWPLCPLVCPWMPLPTLDGTPLMLGLQPLLPLLSGQARVACLECLADLTPMPGCVPDLLLDAALAQPGPQARAWAVPLVVGAAAAARPPCLKGLERVVRLLEVDRLYKHAAAELRGLILGKDSTR